MTDKEISDVCKFMIERYNTDVMEADEATLNKCVKAFRIYEARVKGFQKKTAYED